MQVKPSAILLLLLSLPLSFFTLPGVAQKGAPVTDSPEITLHSSSNLVLVDVIALNARSGLPNKTLTRDDFRIFDNGQPVSITTFDSGAKFTTRPLALWFVVQCNMQGYEAKGSGLFAGQISLFKPPLKGLEKQDTVAVAHWCDDGQSKLDLLPTSDIDEAGAPPKTVLVPVPDTNDHDRKGELALQKTLQLIIDATHSVGPEPLPVVIFLYGDYSGTDRSEADHFIEELLKTSGVASGRGERRARRMW